MSTRKRPPAAREPAPTADDDAISLDALAGDDEAPPILAPSDAETERAQTIESRASEEPYPSA